MIKIAKRIRTGLILVIGVLLITMTLPLSTYANTVTQEVYTSNKKYYFKYQTDLIDLSNNNFPIETFIHKNVQSDKQETLPITLPATKAENLNNDVDGMIHLLGTSGNSWQSVNKSNSIKVLIKDNQVYLSSNTLPSDLQQPYKIYQKLISEYKPTNLQLQPPLTPTVTNPAPTPAQFKSLQESNHRIMLAKLNNIIKYINSKNVKYDDEYLARVLNGLPVEPWRHTWVNIINNNKAVCQGYTQLVNDLAIKENLLYRPVTVLTTNQDESQIMYNFLHVYSQFIDPATQRTYAIDMANPPNRQLFTTSYRPLYGIYLHPSYAYNSTLLPNTSSQVIISRYK